MFGKKKEKKNIYIYLSNPRNELPSYADTFYERV